MTLELFIPLSGGNRFNSDFSGDIRFVAQNLFSSPSAILFLNEQLSSARRENIFNQIKKFTVDQKISKEPLLLIPTSGTTSLDLKIAILTKQNFLNAAKRANQFLRATSADSWLITLPLHHVAGLSILARSYLSKGSVYYLPEWNPEVFLENLIKWKISFCSLVATQIFDLVSKKIKAPPSLKYALVGGSAIADSLFEQMKQLGWPLVKTFGMTETSAFICINAAEKYYQPLNGVSVSLDQNNNLSIKCDSLFEGYLQQNKMEWQYIPKYLNNGFWSTEDRARLIAKPGSEIGFELLGRKQGLIKIKGELVNVNLLNERLNELSTKNNLPPQSLIIHFLADPRNEHELFAVFCDNRSEDVHKLVIQEFNRGVLPFERIVWYIKANQIETTELGKVKTGQFDSDHFKEIYFENRKSILD